MTSTLRNLQEEACRSSPPRPSDSTSSFDEPAHLPSPLPGSRTRAASGPATPDMPDSPLTPPATSTTQGSSDFLDPALLQVRPVKRRLDQLAEGVIRDLGPKKLKPEAANKFRKWTKKSTPEREVETAAMLFALLDPPAPSRAFGEAWDVPQTCKEKLIQYAHRLLLSPYLSAYCDDTIKATLLGYVKKHRWGLPDGIERTDDPRWNLIIREAGKSLTQKRSDIKSEIVKSLEIKDANGVVKQESKDIVTLCTACVQLCKKNNIIVTVQICARFAYIRATLDIVQAPQGTALPKRFWEHVDHELANLRKVTENKADKINKVFAAVLEADRAAFKSPDMSRVTEAVVPLDQLDFDKDVENIAPA